jgi:hypothetical protein
MTRHSHSGARLRREPGIHNPGRSVTHKRMEYGFRQSLRSAGMTAAILLAASNLALAQEAFVGRWAVSPQMCTGRGDTPETSALVATDSSLWWFDGYCRIGKMYKAKAVYVQAHCSGKGDVPVTLDAKGDRMRVTWDRKIEDMRRCP